MRMPFAVWDLLASVAEILPHPPLTRNQVELMQIDTTASDNLPGFRVLSISPRSLEEELEAMLTKVRVFGKRMTTGTFPKRRQRHSRHVFSNSLCAICCFVLVDNRFSDLWPSENGSVADASGGMSLQTGLPLTK